MGARTTNSTRGSEPDGRTRRAPTIYDIAVETGLNASTVSRALRGTGRVSESTVRRVAQAADDLGYRANRVARALHSGRTGTLALILADFTNPMGPRLIRGAERAAAERDYTLVVAESQESSEEESHVLERLVPNVDGVVLAISRLPDDEVRELSRRVPVVVTGRIVEGVASIVARAEPGVSALMGHLTDLGHTSLAYLPGPDNVWMSRWRWELLAREAEERGVQLVSLPPRPPTFEGGRKALEDAIDTGVTAVVAMNDVMAIGLLRRARELGVDVPGQLSVTGFDDVVGAEFTTPMLTTVREPLAELAAVAVGALFARMDGVEPGEPEVPTTRLVVRESTGPVRPGWQ